LIHTKKGQLYTLKTSDEIMVTQRKVYLIFKKAEKLFEHLKNDGSLQLTDEGCLLATVKMVGLDNREEIE